MATYGQVARLARLPSVSAAGSWTMKSTSTQKQVPGGEFKSESEKGRKEAITLL